VGGWLGSLPLCGWCGCGACGCGGRMGAGCPWRRPLCGMRAR